MEDHMANPRDDLTSYLLNVEIEGQKLAPEHVFGTIVLILVAGIDTTWGAVGASLWHLAHHPEDLARLVNEPDLMPVAVEEFLRFYAPVTMARLVKEDMEYLGCPMKEYDWILLGFPAANRDPVVFKDADQFIIDRAENRHVAFGLGIHRCIGSNLARLELRVAIEEFIARYPKFELADPKSVTWAPGQIRGPRQLPHCGFFGDHRLRREARGRRLRDGLGSHRSRVGRTTPTRSGRTCASAARSLTLIATPAAGFPPRTRWSPAWRTTPSTSPVVGSWSSPTTSSRPTLSRPIGGAPPITSDPPFHQIARRLILPAFAPGPINAHGASSTRALHRSTSTPSPDARHSTPAPSTPSSSRPGSSPRCWAFPEEDEDLFRDFVHLVLDLVDLSPEVARTVVRAHGRVL